MDKIDIIKELFEDGVPEPENKTEFRDKVLDNVRKNAVSKTRVRTRDKILDLILSPVPVIIIIASILVIYRVRIVEMLLQIPGVSISSNVLSLSPNILSIFLCILATLMILFFSFKELSEEKTAIDLNQIYLELGGKE